VTYNLQESTCVNHVANASIKEERAASPNLVIKQEPVSDGVIPITDEKSLFRTVMENGQEIIELLDSDIEIELAQPDTGMSSDTIRKMSRWSLGTLSLELFLLGL
jgi:hypothetical protein